MCPILKVWNQAAFESAALNEEFRFAISIQSKGAYPIVLRPDFQGQRLNLYFDDVVEGPGEATPEDVDSLFDFGQRWLPTARSDSALASVVVHCAAGVSRSAAAALLLLTLYFGLYRKAAEHLFRTHPYVSPNALVSRLIFQKLGSAYGADIFDELLKGMGDAQT